MTKRSLGKAKKHVEFYEVEEDTEEEEEEVEERRKRVLIRFSGDSRSSVSSQTTLSCQADDCDAELGTSRRYHRRHKVCERHAKAAVVLVGGVDQRYCQQCSRFHEISQFDDAKRSCRKQLAGHNQRRRKTHPDLQVEDAGQKPAVPTTNDRSWKHARHPEHMRMRLKGNPSFKHFQIW